MALQDWLKVGATALTALATAGVAAFGLWLSRWKIAELSRQQLVDLVSDQKTFLEEKDRLLVGLRDSVQRLEDMQREQKRRLGELEDQLRQAEREEFYRERWIRRVMAMCAAAGLALPPRDVP